MKPESEVKVDAVQVSGDLRIAYTLSAEEKEMLKALTISPYWQLYRKVLLSALNEYTRASWRVNSMDDAIASIQRSGMAAGLNFAINQADVLVTDFDSRKQKSVEKLTEKAKSEFVRG